MMETLRRLLRLSVHFLQDALRQHRIPVAHSQAVFIQTLEKAFHRAGAQDAGNNSLQLPELLLALNFDRCLLEAHQLTPAQFWSGRRESNPRPTAWKAVTLPLSYSRKKAVSSQPLALSSQPLALSKTNLWSR